MGVVSLNCETQEVSKYLSGSWRMLEVSSITHVSPKA
jgi:hypothetical protein